MGCDGAEGMIWGCRCAGRGARERGAGVLGESGHAGVIRSNDGRPLKRSRKSEDCASK